MTSASDADGKDRDLDKLGEPFLLTAAVGILRELAGNAAAERYRASPPPRDQLVKFIRMHDPDAEPEGRCR